MTITEKLEKIETLAYEICMDQNGYDDSNVCFENSIEIEDLAKEIRAEIQESQNDKINDNHGKIRRD